MRLRSPCCTTGTVQNRFLVDGDADVLRFTYRDLHPRGSIARTVLRRLDAA